MKRTFTILISIAMISAAQGKVDLVTLPSRDTVQLTIYNSADMTLVRESRALTLKDGCNSHGPTPSSTRPVLRCCPKQTPTRSILPSWSIRQG
ncbi:MAG: hypothetical protein ACYSWQ_29455 [Planctomycetota bacterium]